MTELGEAPLAQPPASGFVLLDSPVLSRSAVRRDEPLRTDAARQASGWSSARLVVVDERGRTPVEWVGETATLTTRPTDGDRPPADAVLLGEADGVAYWAVSGAPDSAAGDDPARWQDLRMVGAALDPLGAGLLTTAVAVLTWHGQSRFCARDGSPTRPGNAGWHRTCEAAGHEEYPRTDPAVICLVHDGADRVLLARGPVWPAGRFSVLAGFVEAGESLEACVQREILEEVGITVRDVRYLGSQAWPFPRSLMVGFHALADPDEPLVPADGEIAEARWVTRAELRTALEIGDWAGRPGEERPLLLPGRVSIARSMLDSWAALG
ncbi:NAD(+) diphosphatase [Pseudonocardia lacus]|uniref:NAD(+) diphosphatase n=1 Tax=Pseudonocardia lacus TaxID=2835865 RepID=UPI001BDC2D73|nr:NAD(+) diphosphatase [Pseudonocardia lacus]